LLLSQAFEKVEHKMFSTKNTKKDRAHPTIRRVNGPIRSVNVKILGRVDDPDLILGRVDDPDLRFSM